MMTLRRICVFCGSRDGVSHGYRAMAEALGTELARAGIGLVYGGASVGLMGAVANGQLAAGGEVTGVIPQGLAARELMHTGLSALHVVESMHARKALMNELSDGFIAMPGGFGTLDELFEIITWGQLALHRKPIGLLNAFGYFDPLLAFIARMEREGFISAQHAHAMTVAGDPASLIRQMVGGTSMQRAHG